MIFRPKNKKKFNFNIKIGSDDLTESEELTFLGVIIDNKLNFSSHFKKVYAKMKKGLNGLIMVKNQLSYRAKLNVYHGLIHSHLNYCSLIWLSNISKKQLNMLRVLQKKAIRIFFLSNIMPIQVIFLIRVRSQRLKIFLKRKVL